MPHSAPAAAAAAATPAMTTTSATTTTSPDPAQPSPTSPPATRPRTRSRGESSPSLAPDAHTTTTTTTTTATATAPASALPRTLLPTLAGYAPSTQLLADLVAGLTVGTLAIPQSMSYALVAGLPPEIGLYCDLQVAYPVLGRSPHLVVGPVAVMSLLTRSAVASLGLPASANVPLASFLALLVALLQTLLFALGLGAPLSHLLPDAAIAGFTLAAALTIASTQLPALLGTRPASPLSPDPTTVLVSLSSLALLEAVRSTTRGPKLLPKLGPVILMAPRCARAGTPSPTSRSTSCSRSRCPRSPPRSSASRRPSPSRARARPSTRPPPPPRSTPTASFSRSRAPTRSPPSWAGSPSPAPSRARP